MGAVVVSLISLVVGWLLAQITGIVRERLKVWRIKKSLLEELQELRSELDRTLLQFARQLQIHALKGIDIHIPLRLSNHIFKNYYKDAVLYLNQAQRISLQMIHSHIEELNNEIVEFGTLTKRIHEKAQIQGVAAVAVEEGELWGKTVVAQFMHAAEVLWHIRYHLSNANSPELTFKTDTHESFLQYMQSVQDEIQKRITEGKKLDRLQFERIYNPEDFVKKISALQGKS
jgi:hypothetical protein